VSSYVDIFIGQYSIETVLAELARCLSLFPNLHTVQIDVFLRFRRRGSKRRSLKEIFEQTFKNHSYPQIRNVFVMFFSESFIASCPQARRIGFTRKHSMSRSCLQTILNNCPYLEVLEDFDDVFWRPDGCKRAFLYLFLSRSPNHFTFPSRCRLLSKPPHHSI
jgi:hypothetical protein